jgi:gamma-glutamyltranspeptidase
LCFKKIFLILQKINLMSELNIIEQYHIRAKEFAKSYGEEPSDHIINVMASAMMTRDKVLQGGSFVQAVVDNDLASAVSRADSECVKNLRIITLAYRFGQLVESEF